MSELERKVEAMMRCLPREQFVKVMAQVEEQSEQEGSAVKLNGLIHRVLGELGTPAHIKGWSYRNPARGYRIHHNVFDRAAYRMLHLVCHKPESLPTMDSNTYVQYADGLLGQYGANETAEPPVRPFDAAAEEVIASVFGDKNAGVYRIG